MVEKNKYLVDNIGRELIKTGIAVGVGLIIGGLAVNYLKAPEPKKETHVSESQNSKRNLDGILNSQGYSPFRSSETQI